MKSPVRWMAPAVFAFLVAGVAAPACSEDHDREFTPGLSTVTTTQPSSTGTGQGGSEPFDPCSCLETTASETGSAEPCTACHRTKIGNDGACASAQAACESSPDCVNIANCIGDCNATGVDLACIGGCVYTLPSPQARDLYLGFVECLCTECTDSCNTSGNAQCIPNEGGGGAGGAGGAFGGGGAGGATGGDGAGGRGGDA